MGVFWTAIKLIVFPLVLITSLVKLSVHWDRSPTCLVGKTAIVTAADTGLSFYIALDFAKRGAQVILGCKNVCKGKCARSRIIQATRNTNIYIKPLDFGSLTSVREFAEEINGTRERLDILVNHSGTAGFDDKLTRDGLNPIMQTHYYGPFLLTLLLLDLLKKSAPSRIVNISSAAAHFAKLPPDVIESYSEESCEIINNFANSKLCNIIFTNELARKLKGYGVTANSLHPGLVKTDIFKKTRGLKKLGVKILEHTIFKTPEEGAQTAIYLAVSRDLEGVTGQYFDNCSIAWFPPMPTPARDTDLAKSIWSRSKEIVKLNPSEYEFS